MKTVRKAPTTPRAVASSFGSAANQLGALVVQTVEEKPQVALAGALAAGFVIGGGLISPLGMRIAATTLRATLGNVATMAALDVLRRELIDGGSRGSSGHARRTE
jgi:hypothetical protein